MEQSFEHLGKEQNFEMPQNSLKEVNETVMSAYEEMSSLLVGGKTRAAGFTAGKELTGVEGQLFKGARNRAGEIRESGQEYFLGKSAAEIKSNVTDSLNAWFDSLQRNLEFPEGMAESMKTAERNALEDRRQDFLGILNKHIG